MSQSTIAQQRAKHALGQITAYSSKSKEEQEKYNSYVASFGPMILMSGFGQACAFYIANKKTEHKDVLGAVTDWLKLEGRPFHERKGHIVECITNCDKHIYRLAQVEALEYLDWLKKFAKAFLKSKEQGDSL